MSRRRIDVLLVEQGLAASREQAQALVMAGAVRAGGAPVSKPGALVEETLPLAVAQRPPYVSRGGLKLAHALDRFGVDVTGLVCADIGASTGGFTDVLLQQGARRVYAVDVGYGQLDYRLRTDSRVMVLDRVNARYPLPIPEPVDLATIDVAFISLELVIPSVAAALRAGRHIVALVKPQFEVGKEKVGKGGVVRDPVLHAEVLRRIILWTIAQRLRLRGLTASPILGDRGNREFFIFLEKGRAS
ncbi:MAG: TlyA family RNA methyltransferase [Chloroflexi bacterium]|nr:TlyA family RNA methyltransferase [Chloroflexota bacterium]